MEAGKHLWIVLLAIYGLAAGAAEPQLRDKGWMAHNMNGGCEMARAGLNLDSSETEHTLLVQANRDPRDREGHSRTRLSFALLGAKKVVEMNSGVVSFSVLDGAADSAARLTVKPLMDAGLSMILDKNAEAALSMFATERLVRVDKSDGSTAVFRFPVKGYASSKAMFEACARVLSKGTE